MYPSKNEPFSDERGKVWVCMAKNQHVRHQKYRIILHQRFTYFEPMTTSKKKLLYINAYVLFYSCCAPVYPWKIRTSKCTQRENTLLTRRHRGSLFSHFTSIFNFPDWWIFFWVEIYLLWLTGQTNTRSREIFFVVVVECLFRVSINITFWPKWQTTEAERSIHTSRFAFHRILLFKRNAQHIPSKHHLLSTSMRCKKSHLIPIMPLFYINFFLI